MAFDIQLTAAAFIGGAIASLTGFGIGSILTPLLSIEVGIWPTILLLSVAVLVGTMVGERKSFR